MIEPIVPVPGWRGGDGDAAYLDKTLTHQPIELWLDESINWRTILGLWFQAAIVSVVGFFVVFLPLAFATRDSVDSYAFAAVAGVILFLLVFLLSTQHEPIGEWRALLADRAPAAPSVYSHIAGRIRDRRMPVYAQMRRIPTGLNTVGNHLVMINGFYQVYVSVFAFGTSLYLGWAMWRSRRGFDLAARFVADIVAGITGRLDPIGMMLRTEPARAMREAAHSLCREGLHIAVEQIAIPDTYGFPRGLPPIENVPPGSSSPPPGPLPPPDGRQ
jgi:hypothetical protein